jgi:UDP-glucose 4-epimerase
VNEHFGVIYHLAAEREKTQAPEQIISHNFQSTLDVLEYMRSRDIQNMILASSSSVYGPGCGQYVNERSQIKPSWNSYAISKYVSEELSIQYAEKYGLRIAIARIFPVYGGAMEDPRRLIPSFFEKIITGKRIVLKQQGRQSRDFIYVDDVCRALSIIASSNTADMYNISTNVGTTLYELIQIISKITEKKANIKFEDSEAADLGNIGDNSKLRSLGFNPQVSLEEGLKKYYHLVFQRRDS